MIAVGFDFDHTLGVDGGLEKRAFAQLFGEIGAPIDRDAHGAAIDAALARFRDWQGILDEAIAGFAEGLGKAWNLRAPSSERFREICYALVDEMVQPVEGARETLAALDAAGIPHAILTNGWAPLQQKKIARALGDYPHPILVSETLGVQKPDPRAFAALCEAFGVAAHDVWYVGDNPRADAAGAVNAGLRGVWFDHEGARYPADAAQPAAVIHTLHALLPLVRGAAAPTTKP